MADFALWATACETALWPAGTCMRAYEDNRRAAIEGVIEADPVADHVRDMMAKATTWTGSASDLYRIDADRTPNGCSARSSGWPKSPRALAGRLRRAQTSLRALGIEIAFSREGRGGTRIIRITASHENSCENIVSTVSDREPSKPEREPGRPVWHPNDADGADLPIAERTEDRPFDTRLTQVHDCASSTVQLFCARC
jgi:hypothetical protein